MDIIKFCLLLCENSYKEEDALLEIYKEKDLNILREKNARGLSVEYDNDLYICWSGLADTKEFLKNFMDYNNNHKEDTVFNNNICGKVHECFFEYYSKLRNKTMNIVKTFLNNNGSKDKRIYFVGYSLGASILLSALEIKLLLTDINTEIFTITFGSPKLGNKKFSKIFNALIDNSLRFYDSDDIVCTYPIEYGYYHVNKGLDIKENKKYSWLRLLWRWISCLKRTKRSVEYYVKQHTIENYKNKMI
jgi:hypothetical protein